MRIYPVLIGTVFVLAGLSEQVNAGPLMRKMEMKQMQEQQAAQKSAASSASSNQAHAKESGADKTGSKFETSKTKCKELGNQEGSDKFNSCVMTLME